MKMKVCVIQPAYSTDYTKIDEYFEAQLALMAKCDETMDLIVLPEMCDIPCLAKTKEQADSASDRYTARVLDEASRLARRCHAMVFICARDRSFPGGDFFQ